MKPKARTRRSLSRQYWRGIRNWWTSPERRVKTSPSRWKASSAMVKEWAGFFFLFLFVLLGVPPGSSGRSGVKRLSVMEEEVEEVEEVEGGASALEFAAAIERPCCCFCSLETARERAANATSTRAARAAPLRRDLVRNILVEKTHGRSQAQSAPPPCKLK